ncbi:helix-turn-helix domain-containing protein [Herbaspirillum sp. RTI4]|uniref:helix-turn-helix domain-containing protein n=1 Tax=Herbaspirillum sp. RTI4 TaxID=3048640 RepID=UPI002AB4B5A5|nr:helix-turn-helix domain-containing protein [Herbaspirillum sp. RTI4]MDY7578161.1 helix-turn-helix domain-containing protein [Herbaspirillum sp. RTI4]MEA9980750.1 helix-turn-helix domain-containing protein [Herbaspirillum sp. RTI4]
MENAILKACRLVGGQSKLAKALGISPQAVQQWVSRQFAPACRCRAIETATLGRVSRFELRPDIFGDGSDRGDKGDRGDESLGASVTDFSEAKEAGQTSRDGATAPPYSLDVEEMD